MAKAPDCRTVQLSTHGDFACIRTYGYHSQSVRMVGRPLCLKESWYCTSFCTMVIVTVSTGDCPPDCHQVLVLVACPLVALMGDMVAKFVQSDAAKRLGLLRPTPQVNCIVLVRSVTCHCISCPADGKPTASIIASPSSGIIFTSPEVIKKVGHLCNRHCHTCLSFCLLSTRLIKCQSGACRTISDSTCRRQKVFRPAFAKLEKARS